jgi:hypothetical protein
LNDIGSNSTVETTRINKIVTNPSIELGKREDTRFAPEMDTSRQHYTVETSSLIG